MAKLIYRCVGQARCAGLWVFVLLAGMVSSPCWAEPPATQAPSNTPPAGKAADLEGLLNLDIEQLAKTPVTSSASPSMDMPVTSVTKEAGTVGRSAAAVFVITNEMIRRSGVTNDTVAYRY